MSSRPLHSNPHLAHTEKLGHEIARLAAHIHAATYRFLVLIREFDRLGGWGDQGCVSCAHWLSWRCGISVHTGREKLRVAKALETLPSVSEAFEQGRISYSKARAITRVATAHNEEYLLGIAFNGTAAHLDKLVRHEDRRRRSNERKAPATDPYQQRHIEWFEDDNGCVVFKVCLPGEEAARVIRALDACRDQHFRDGVPAGTAAGNATLSQRRADAFVALADDWLLAKRQTKSNADAYQVVLHVPAGTLAEPMRLDEDTVISTEAAKRICCDAGIVPMLEDAEGRVLDVGRKTRVISPALRRALNKRDDHSCRFPGCTHTRYLHGHHIVHWADGGETKLDNLVLLCSHHHHLVHDDGFGCAVVRDEILFTTPDGAVLPRAMPLAGLSELGESAGTFENDLIDYNLHKDACLPNYHGDGMDYDLALQGLAELDQPSIEMSPPD